MNTNADSMAKAASKYLYEQLREYKFAMATAEKQRDIMAAQDIAAKIEITEYLIDLVMREV